MTDGPWVLKRFGGTWRFKELKPGETEVRFIYNFVCRPAILRGLVEPVVGLIYRRDMARRLKAFKIWSEALSQ
jgi:ribosome-associated toxin RatA of RatAB toxin-antitoxin module